jgi:hypothetical protein
MIPHVAAIGCLLSGCLALLAGGQDTDHEASVRAARDVLRAKSEMPWYDPDQDAIRRINAQPGEDDEHRQSRWASDQATSTTSASARPPSLFWRIMQILAWLTLSALLVAIMWLLVWAAGRMDRSGLIEGKIIDRVEVDPERTADLPMSIPPTDRNLLAAAQSCYEAGDYGTAIIYAYAYQLVELDRHHAIQLGKGKTNRQYLRELRTQPRLRELLRDTMLAFEDVFFGNHSLSRPQFQRCWDSLDEFHRQLEQMA